VNPVTVALLPLPAVRGAEVVHPAHVRPGGVDLAFLTLRVVMLARAIRVKWKGGTPRLSLDLRAARAALGAGEAHFPNSFGLLVSQPPQALHHT